MDTFVSEESVLVCDMTGCEERASWLSKGVLSRHLQALVRFNNNEFSLDMALRIFRQYVW